MHTPCIGLILRPDASQRVETSSLSHIEVLPAGRIALASGLTAVGVWCSVLVRCDAGGQ